MTAARLFSAIILMLMLAACGRSLSRAVSESPALSMTTVPPPLVTPALSGHTPSFTPEPVAVIEVNVNVRNGPGTHFEKIGLLVANSEVAIRGKNSDGSWWQIQYPPASNGLGWIAAEFASTDQADIVPVVLEPTAAAGSPPLQLEAVVNSTLDLHRANILTPTTSATSTPSPYRLVLKINPKAIHASECARLNYETETLTDLRINGESLPVDEGRGSLVVCPEATTTYHVSGVSLDGRVVSQTIVLNVIPVTPTIPVRGGSILASTTPGCKFAVETLGTSHDNLCRFSPDGQQIAAPAADGSLWIIGVDGKAFQQVVNPARRFFIWGDTVWSPNGEYLAFSAVGLDGLGAGVGYYEFATGRLTYLGPDAQAGKSDTAAWPRWTQDGRLIITWYQGGQAKPGIPSLFGPALYAPDSPVPLEEKAELLMSAGAIGQQVYPWKPGKVWIVGQSPSYEVDY